MYHVAGIGSTVLILYFISYLFYLIGYYPLSFHKKLWNSILAIAFLVTALAGIFMALQISYKWNIPNAKSILRWHVEFGTGMAFTGILHFLMHLSYFGKFFTREDRQEKETDIIHFIQPCTTEIRLNLFIAGFVSSSVQLLLIREMMNISGGYELIAGIFLGTWLIASAAGSALAGRSQLKDPGKIFLFFSLSPLISLFLLFLLARIFLETGETPSFLISLVYTLIVLLPFCMISGFTFVRLISLARKTYGMVPGKSFSIETTGGIISGIVVSALIAGNLGTYKLLIVIISLSVAYAILTYYVTDSRQSIAVKLMFTLAISLAMILEPDVLFRQIMLPGIKVFKSEDTPYGNITMGKYKGETSIYYNHRLLRYNDDVIEREEDIHYAMLQHKSPQQVILISGSPDSHLPEIWKYPVEKVTYVERDPELTKFLLTDSLKKKVIISNSDAFDYIKNSPAKADVIIMLVPPPSTLLLNRYYTTEFFFMIKNRLNKDGVFMCSPGTGDTYFNNESIRLNSSVFNSLKEAFLNVLPIAGNKLYFIASDNKLSTSICILTEQRGINNNYVSSDYLADDLIERKSNEIYKIMDPEIKKNNSAFPVAYNYFQSYHFSKNKNEKTPLLVLFIILFALPVLMVKKKNLAMYLSASALAGFEIIVLLTLQLTVGNMYQLTGLIIAGLMCGLAVGSGSETGRFFSIPIPIKSLIMMFFYVGFALIHDAILGTENKFMAISLILILSFIPAFITGSIFRDLTRENDSSNNSASVYSADLSGSALGFIAVSGFIVPAFGIKVTIYFLGLLVFAGFLLGTIRNKH